MIEQKKMSSHYKNEIIDSILRYGENPLSVITNCRGGEKINISIEDIRHYFSKKKAVFDYLMEE